MDVDTLLHAKAELLSYIPVQQLEMKVSISCSCTYFTLSNFAQMHETC